jgi:16S rRNA (cytosine1402-N4)-methyltransferase
MEFSHQSVLLHETIDALAIRPDGIYIDGTAGGAGHSRAIAEQLTTGRLVAIDKDPTAVAVATERLAPYPCAKVVQNDFRNIRAVWMEENLPPVNGVLLDLGVSSYQLDCAERGFSYQHEAPLDMRMSQSGMSAADVVNTYSEHELIRVLRDWGEEKFAPRIARAIAAARQDHPIRTTTELADLIRDAIPAACRREGGHPAKRSFQAIRIEVNGELDALRTALDDAFSILAVGGRLAILTFQSLEDRMVKQAFAEYAKGCTCPPEFPVCVCGKTPRGRLVTRKPVTATEEELAENRRSHSAKLRCIEKLHD